MPQSASMVDSQMKILIRKALLYAAMSGLLLSVDIALLWILLHYFLWRSLLAATVSFSAHILLSYILSVTAVFKCRRIKNQPIEFARFAAAGIVGLAINDAAMSFGEGNLGAHYRTVKCAVACLTFVWNSAERPRLLFVST
jgi:putative flippase GtrA